MFDAFDVIYRLNLMSTIIFGRKTRKVVAAWATLRVTCLLYTDLYILAFQAGTYNTLAEAAL